jgi:acetyltransferase
MEATEAVLRDGSQVRIRPIHRDDLERERRFVAGLSTRTGYLRLLSGRRPTSAELEHWTDVDPTREFALIAVVGQGDQEEMVGVSRCAIDVEDPARWDFAVVLADAWQARGLGKVLLQRLLSLADERGIALISGVTLTENRGMLALALGLGFTARREIGDATLMRIERRLRPDDVGADPR